MYKQPAAGVFRTDGEKSELSVSTQWQHKREDHGAAYTELSM